MLFLLLLATVATAKLQDHFLGTGTFGYHVAKTPSLSRGPPVHVSNPDNCTWGPWTPSCTDTDCFIYQTRTGTPNCLEARHWKCGNGAAFRTRCADNCPNNPQLLNPTPLALPPSLPAQAAADAVWNAFTTPLSFPFVVAWDIPFPKPAGAVADVAPLSRGPANFHFNLAGGLLTQIRILYFSSCEYLIEINSPVETSGYGGRYPGVEFEDLVLRGSVATWTDQQLQATWHQQGQRWNTPATTTGVPQAYGFGEQGGLLLERALFPSAQSVFSLLQFGTAYPTEFISRDFETAYQGTCQVATSILLNTVSLAAAGALQAAGATPGDVPTKAAVACPIWHSVAPIVNITFCGYDLVELLRVKFPTEAAQITTLCPLPPPAVNPPLSPDLDVRFENLLDQLQGLFAIFSASGAGTCNKPATFAIKNSYDLITQPTCGAQAK